MSKFQKILALFMSIIFVFSIPLSAFAAENVQEETVLISTQEVYDNEGNSYVVVCEKIIENSNNITPYSLNPTNVEHMRYTVRSGGSNGVYLDPEDTGYIARVDLCNYFTSSSYNGVSDYYKLLTDVSWSWTILDSSFTVDSAEVYYCCKQSHENTINVKNRNPGSQATGFTVYGDAYNESIGSWIHITWRQGTRTVDTELVCNIGGSLSIGGRW